VIHSLASSALGFRGIFALVALPLAAVPFLYKRIEEPDRFRVAEVSAERPLPVLGAVGPRFRRRLFVVAILAFAVSVITGPATSFVFLYAQNVLHQPGYVTAAMVVGAGLSGLVGLLAGRWLADHLGRRPTAASAMIALALFSVLTYEGSSAALLLGYIFG
jgi:predicted MFS family arabinose efflux permease